MTLGLMLTEFWAATAYLLYYLSFDLGLLLLIYIAWRVLGSITKFCLRRYLRIHGDQRTGVIVKTSRIGFLAGARPLVKLTIQVTGSKGETTTRRYRKQFDRDRLPLPGDPIEVYRSRTNPSLFVPA